MIRSTAAVLLSLLATGVALGQSPNATPRMTDASQSVGPDNTYFLFVQTAESGTIEEVIGSTGVFVLRLAGVAPSTIYFSDRPARISGQAPMDKFLKGFGFSDANPPNAAIEWVGPHGPSVTVVELMRPVYNASAATLTYHVRLLDPNEVPEGLSHVSSPAPTLPAHLSKVALFIDDCPNTDDICWADAHDAASGCYFKTKCGDISRGTCYNWKEVACRNCHNANSDCGSKYPDCCATSDPLCGGCRGNDNSNY